LDDDEKIRDTFREEVFAEKKRVGVDFSQGGDAEVGFYSPVASTQLSQDESGNGGYGELITKHVFMKREYGQ